MTRHTDAESEVKNSQRNLLNIKRTVKENKTTDI